MTGTSPAPPILVIDTATENCGAAVIAGDTLLASEEHEVGRGHAGHILPMVERVLAAASLRLHDCAAIGFGRGPGAFTGVRLAASLVQGLAFSTGLPVLPVSTLRVLAAGALRRHPAAPGVLVCADARMRELYTARYRRDAVELARLEGPERVLPALTACAEADSGAVVVTGAGSVADAGASDAPAATRDWVGAGRGFRAHPQLAEAWRARLAAIDDDALPQILDLARLAAVDFAQGRALPPEGAMPVYLRDRVAEEPASHGRS